MNKVLPAALGILMAATLSSCQNTPCKLTAADSAKIAKAYRGTSKPAFFFYGDKHQFDASKDETKHTQPITDSEARVFVRNYMAAPLPNLQVRDVSSENFVNIKAFEIDGNVIDTIRKYAVIRGLRCYLGRRPDNAYTLVIIPKSADQENILNQPWLFDWNNPCPPYCPPKAQQFPD